MRTASSTQPVITQMRPGLSRHGAACVSALISTNSTPHSTTWVHIVESEKVIYFPSLVNSSLFCASIASSSSITAC